jgi:hypothetical protein
MMCGSLHRDALKVPVVGVAVCSLHPLTLSAGPRAAVSL